MADSKYGIKFSFTQDFWDSVPDWVEYVVMGADMEWIGFENEPAADADGMWRDAANGKSIYLYPAWNDTLQRRRG